MTGPDPTGGTATGGGIGDPQTVVGFDGAAGCCACAAPTGTNRLTTASTPNCLIMLNFANTNPRPKPCTLLDLRRRGSHGGRGIWKLGNRIIGKLDNDSGKEN